MESEKEEKSMEKSELLESQHSNIIKKISKFQSNLTKEDIEFLIENVLPDDVSKMKPIWRLSEKKGFKASKFHEKCDGIKNTIFICENDKGQKFGGINFLTWDKSSVGKETDKNKIFSITKRTVHGIMMNESGKNKGNRISSKAIGYDKNSGPIMGVTDLIIGNNCDKDETCTSDFDIYEFTLEEDAESYLGNAESFKLKNFYIYSFS